MHTIDSIKVLLLSNDRAVERAMVVLFDRQTIAEQAQGTTTDHNGRGFNAFDAKNGTYYAKWVLSKRYLTGKHLAKARAMSFRYARQLLEAAQEREAILATCAAPASPPTVREPVPNIFEQEFPYLVGAVG